jgi:hypothetical protein
MRYETQLARLEEGWRGDSGKSVYHLSAMAVLGKAGAD